MRTVLMTLIITLISYSTQSCKKNKVDSNETNVEPPITSEKYFKNPVLAGYHADPFVAQKDGFYYFLATRGNHISIAKTRSMSQLASAEHKQVWKPAANTEYSAELWAPELHFLEGKWYIYFAAAESGVGGSNRMFVLENANADPTQGVWTFKGRIFDPANDHFAIDGSILTIAGKNYFIWSGQESNEVRYKQLIYIAPMSNPWTLSGARVLISEPTNIWEKYEPASIGIGVNEGPIAIQRDENSPVFIIFSASRYTSDNYCLAQVQLKNGGDPLVSHDWINKKQVFLRNDEKGVYAPGHNGFFTSSGKNKDGLNITENWLIYHARSTPNDPHQTRTTRMQKFNWNADGSPNFGTPTGTDQFLLAPIGD